MLFNDLKGYILKEKRALDSINEISERSQQGEICNSSRILIKHIMSIQAKKIENDSITKYHINNIHQINWYNQTLRFSCNNIVNIYGGIHYI